MSRLLLISLYFVPGALLWAYAQGDYRAPRGKRGLLFALTCLLLWFPICSVGYLYGLRERLK